MGNDEVNMAPAPVPVVKSIKPMFRKKVVIKAPTPVAVAAPA